MANHLLFTLGRALDANGNTAAGAKAYIYEAGTTTPLTAYQDSAATTQHANPIVADGGGLFAAAYINADSAKVVITKSDDTVLQTLDPCPVISVGGVGASGISFSPTVDIPETNVQDAIEAAAETAASGFAPFGLGVTGNAPDLANIDATNIGTGFYRTTASTTGTFPAGITASSTSVIRMERETSALGVMTLMDDSGRAFRRYMVASAWGSWRESSTFAASAGTGAIPYMGASGATSLAAGTNGYALVQASGIPSWSNLGFSKGFQSSDLSIPSATGNTGNIAHGLGSAPKFIISCFVCAVGNNGYSVGDVIPNIPQVSGTNSDLEYGVLVRANATNLIGVTGQSGLRLQDTTGVAIPMTLTDWRLRLFAFA